MCYRSTHSNVLYSGNTNLCCTWATSATLGRSQQRFYSNLADEVKNVGFANVNL